MATTACFKISFSKCCVGVVICIYLRIIVARVETSIPWVSNPDSKFPAEQYMEIPPSIFAPNGHLYSLEAVLQACEDDSDPSSNSVIAIRCADGVVLVTTMHKSPYLNDSYGSSSDGVEVIKGCTSLIIHDDNDKHAKKVTQSMPYFAMGRSSQSSTFGAVAGNAADSQIMKRKILRNREVSHPEDFFEVATLARKIADQNQMLTQNSGKGRILVSKLLLLSANEIWRVDPTGQFCSCSAAVIGRSSRIAEQILWDKIYSQRSEKPSSTPFFWSGMAKSSSRQNLSTRDAMHHTLSELTIEQAMALATECIWHSTVAGGENTMGPANSTIILRGLSIRKKESCQIQDEVQFYNHETLKRLLYAQ